MSATTADVILYLEDIFLLEFEKFTVINLRKNIHERFFAFAEYFIAWFAGFAEFLSF